MALNSGDLPPPALEYWDICLLPVLLDLLALPPVQGSTDVLSVQMVHDFPHPTEAALLTESSLCFQTPVRWTPLPLQRLSRKQFV